MKYYATFFITLLVFSFSIKAQQLTQDFTFTTGELVFSQNTGYDIVNLPNTGFLVGEGFAGQPNV